MPVIRGQKDYRQVVPRERKEMVDALCTELLGTEPPQPNPPYIFELPQEGSRAFGVTAIWTRFDGIASEDRTDIVMAAYKKLGDSNRLPRKADVQGLTIREALECGALPYQIVPAARYEDGEGEYSTTINNAMFEAGAIPGPDGKPELRFPTRRMAEQALGELYSRMPKALWRISEWN